MTRTINFDDGFESENPSSTETLPASDVTNTPSGNLSSTNQQDVNNELQSDIDTRATAASVTDHLNDATDAHDASSISNVPSGNLSSTNVQDALNELQTELNGALVNPMTTGGDLIYGGASGVPTRIANGTLNQFLKSAGGTAAPVWTHAVNGDVQTKTTTYTALVSDSVVLCSTTGGAWTLTFPTAVGCSGKILGCKKTTSDFNAVTLTGTGMTTNYLMTGGETVFFISDGTNWNQIYRHTNTAWADGTVSGSFTNTTYIARWRRVGDSIEILYNLSFSAGPAAGSLTLNIINSAGWTIDGAKMYGNASNDNLGTGSMLDSGTANHPLILGYSSATAIAALVGVASGTYLSRASVTNSIPVAAITSSDTMYFRTVLIPITNFSA